MCKTYKGKEIFKMIAEGGIDKNTKVTVDNYNRCTLDFVFEDERNLFEWLDEDFKLIEDNNIDIEEIENDVMRDDWRYYVPLFFNKINELVRKYNELNKEIKELKK